ncbi:MAG: glycine cleavage system aminomethyltransferase GcvT [Chlorobi bacterium]|nr:glycine cleavage system aminomethyltransferase GcvT [Chlorobiota bacterium]
MKRTPLYDWHIASGAKMTPFAGYEMPLRYSGINEEHMAVRRRAGLFDVSHMGNFLVRGPEARRFLQYVTTNDVEKLYPGKVQYTLLTREDGGIVDDLLLYQLDDDTYMLVVNAANREKDMAHLKKYATGFDVNLTDHSDDTAILALQGPLAPEILAELAGEEVRAMPFYTHRMLPVVGVEDVWVSATGYTGEKGYELYVPASEAPRIWKALLEAGGERLTPAGLGARDTLRLEKGYGLYGQDMDESTTPLEARLGWITKLHTGFLGSEAVRKQKEEGLKRVLTGFVMEDKGIPRTGYDILDADGRVIGKVTSGTRSPVLEKGIGMGYVPPAFLEPGTPLLIRIRGKDFPARTVKLPFV